MSCIRKYRVLQSIGSRSCTIKKAPPSTHSRIYNGTPSALSWLQVMNQKFYSTSNITLQSKSNTKHDKTQPEPYNNSQERVLIKDLGDGIFNIQLNRPKKCNALDMNMFESIASTISNLQMKNHGDISKNVRCIILSGNGRAFCTGLDVPSMMKPNEDGILPHTKMNRLLERPSGYDKGRTSTNSSVGDTDDRGINISSSSSNNIGIGNLAQDVAYLWRTIPIPVIAVLHGMCYGGGLQIALGADIRIATDDCKISIMEAKWGLIPDMSASITLRELIPIDVAKELTFTGRIIDGNEAKAFGLVTKCISKNSLNSEEMNNKHGTALMHDGDDKSFTAVSENVAMVEAIKLAKEMVKQSPDAIAAAKLMYQRTWVDLKEEQCLDLESRLQKKLLPSWNQFAASTKNFGLKLSYVKQKDLEV